MKVYTSYFARAGALQKVGIVPIGIALSPPRHFWGGSIGYIAPKYWMLKLPCEEYTRKYHAEVLAHLDPKAFVLELERLSAGNDVALLCYESPEKFCHRQLVAQWLRKGAGIEIEEWSYTPPAPPEEKKSAAQQQSLFDF